MVTGKFDKHQKVSKSYENDCSYFRFSDNLFLLNSTLISKILLLKLDRTRGKFCQGKRSVVLIPPPQEHIGLTVSLKLCQNLCSLGD